MCTNVTHKLILDLHHTTLLAWETINNYIGFFLTLHASNITYRCIHMPICKHEYTIIILYLKWIVEIRGGRWPSERNKMQKMECYLNSCTRNSNELKNFVMDKFSKGIWWKELGRKKKYYVHQFNPTCNLQEKQYIGASILWRENSIIAWLRSNSHQL